MCIVVQPESSGADNVSDVCGIVFVLARQVWHFCFLFCFCVWCVVVRRAVCVYVRTPLKHGCDVTCSMTDVRYVRFVWRV